MIRKYTKTEQMAFNNGVQFEKQEILEDVKKIIENLVFFTCECGCVTFDNKKCRLCGKSPKYGELDYDNLKQKIEELRK